MSRTYEQLEPVISALDERIKTNLGAFPTDTAEGSIVSFPDGADDVPLKSLVVNIDPVQSGSGDPSPDNVRPISGWTGMQIQHTGKNLLALPFVYYTGVSTDLSNYFFIKAGTYVFSFSVSTASSWRFIVCLKDLDGNVISDSQHNPSDTLAYRGTLNGYANGGNTIAKELVLNIAEDCYIRILHWKTANPQTDTFNDCKLELGSTPTDYEPYNGQTIPIDWQTEAGTVYGGSLDVLSGVLTVYPYYASYNGETLTGRWISDRDVYAVGTTPTIGAQVVNIGAEGTEIQLEPHEVASLLGHNNIFADTGDTEVEYRADTKMYIERLTEPDADMIADSNIVSGQYFMVGNSLYLATSNIASGGQVIVGTNCTQKSLATALNEINQ